MMLQLRTLRLPRRKHESSQTNTEIWFLERISSTILMTTLPRLETRVNPYVPRNHRPPVDQDCYALHWNAILMFDCTGKLGRCFGVRLG